MIPRLLGGWVPLSSTGVTYGFRDWASVNFVEFLNMERLVVPQRDAIWVVVKIMVAFWVP